MEEVGRVKVVKAKRVLVEIKPSGFCGGCGQREGCGLLFSSGKKTVEAKNDIGAKEGDWVKLTFNEKKEFFSSLLLFGLPLLFLIIGVIFFNLWGGVIGIFFAFFLLGLVNIFFKKRGLFLPIVTAIVKQKEEER
ncbi:MAG: SoxR reducing system RseC family protein [candidate division WOR-3 bacterium]